MQPVGERPQGAPESAGLCRPAGEGHGRHSAASATNATSWSCAPLLDLTHAYDVASRWWLLPLIHSVANGTAKALLSGLISRMGCGEAGRRLSFSEAIAWLDESRVEPENVTFEY